MKHSATYLFGDAKAYNAFDGGTWNARLRDGGISATDFNQSGVVPLLQSDLEHFVEENNGLLESLFNDFRGCLHNGDSVVVFLIVFQTVELLLVKLYKVVLRMVS
jgi:hypothetical protein